jgi:hypothetical protein
MNIFMKKYLINFHTGFSSYSILALPTPEESIIIIFIKLPMNIILIIKKYLLVNEIIIEMKNKLNYLYYKHLQNPWDLI